MTLRQFQKAWHIRASLMALGITCFAGGFFLSLGPTGTACTTDPLGGVCLPLGMTAMTGYLVGALFISVGTARHHPIARARILWRSRAFSTFCVTWSILLFGGLTWFLGHRYFGSGCADGLSLWCLGGKVLTVFSGSVTLCLLLMGSILIPRVEQAFEGDW